MNIKEFITATNSKKHDGFILRPLIVCADGFIMSVQASRGHYSTPRDLAESYSSFEVGYPNIADDLLTPFADDMDNPTNAIYGHVPSTIIDAVIEKHGGIDIKKTFKK